jgi:uroporphyrinogen-III decarboxylase
VSTLGVELDRLIDEYLSIVESPENRARGQKWESDSPVAYYYWQEIPKPVEGSIPVVVVSMNAFYHEAFGLDLEKYYTQPEAYLEGYLKACLFKFHQFKDDTHFLPEVPIWFGPTFVPNLLGSGVIYSRDKDPWISHKVVLEKREDLDRLEPPDFRKSGMMPLAHRSYEELNELVGDRLKVRFTDWLRGPFVSAFHMRGVENILIDMLDAPEFVHRLMRFITDCRKGWSRERAHFLGEEIGPSDFYNDEVNVPLLSPDLYREFVLPYERELCDFYGQIGYWHSCGDTGPLAPAIKEIPHLNLINSSGWTDLSKTLAAYGPSGIPLEVNIHPLRDLQQATEEQMEAKLQEIVQACRDAGVKAYFIRVDSLELLAGLEEDIAQGQLWLEVARRVTAGL